MEGKSAVRNRFKAPEGRYELVSESKQLIHFHHLRWTRLTRAVLDYGFSDTDGIYVLFNVGDYIHITPWDATHKEPLRSLAVCNTTTLPLSICHDFKPAGADGVDTVVGVGNGSVHLMSLRAQLQGPASSTKPTFAATLTPEPTPDAKCVAVLWLPKSDGTFVAGFASGHVYLYKKTAILGEGTGRFSLGLGASKQSIAPYNTISIGGRGLHDLAVSPCGTRLAAACCDGALRLIDVANGAVIGGFQSYYGAMLCCGFSPDGRYIAAASEDDLIAVYSVSERCLIAHCQGHGSWESRVQWDPWMQLGGLGGSGAALGGADTTRLYRLASVGQDAQMCLWDVQTLPPEGDLFVTPAGSASSMKKSGSTANLATSSPSRGSNDSPRSGQHHLFSHQRKPSVSKPAVPAGGILPSPLLADMNFVQPSMQHRVHYEPMSDVLFTETCILTADYCGSIRTWKRPTQLHRLSVQRAAAMSAVTGSAKQGDHSPRAALNS